MALRVVLWFNKQNAERERWQISRPRCMHVPPENRNRRKDGTTDSLLEDVMPVVHAFSGPFIHAGRPAVAASLQVCGLDGILHFSHWLHKYLNLDTADGAVFDAACVASYAFLRRMLPHKHSGIMRVQRNLEIISSIKCNRLSIKLVTSLPFQTELGCFRP